MKNLNVQNMFIDVSIFLTALALPVLAHQAAADVDLLAPKDWLEQRGVDLGASLTADFSKNISGGASHAGTTRHLFDFSVGLDLGTIAGIDGGSLYIDFQTQNGQDGSVETGDLQAYSNIDAPGFTALYEFWYQQFFFDSRLRVKAGKIDANADFAFVEHGGEFIHSSAGFSPTIFALPTYPDPAFGALAFIGEGKGVYAGVGVFDGALQEGFATGALGPATFFGDPADLFFIGEAGYTWGGERSLSGRVAAGAWHHDGTFAQFSGGTKGGATGFFVVYDQMLYQEQSSGEDGQGIGLFAQYGWADPELSEVEHHFGLGTQWTGALPCRDEDVVGLMVSWAELSDKPGAGFTDDAEVAVEWFYKLHLCDHVSLKPDVQYIVNPGGAGLDDAWVATLRVEFVY